MTSDIEMRMNLAAIKKTDPYAKEIIESSAHVAFYTFNSAINEWEKTDVEGAFFIYSRNAEPYQSIFINNRLNTNSFVEPITGSLELQPQRPFLLYRNERSRIRGFWFYNNSECDRIGDIIKKLIEGCNDRKENINSQPNSSASVLGTGNSISGLINNNNNNSGGGGQDNNSILTLLTKAQENYNSSQQRVANGNGGGTPTMEQSQRIPQTPVTPLKLEANNASESVLNFFAKAKPTPTSDVPLLQRLNSLNPVSVDQIEKQQRVTTPVSSTSGGGDLLQIHSNLVENSFAQFKIGVPQTNDMENSPLAKFLGANNLGRPSQTQNDMRSNAPNKPALMPPTMFATTTATANPVKEEAPSSLTSSGIQHAWEADKMPEPLTQSQLTQAISYLMRNDPGFVRKIHEAYLKSFTDMVSL